MITYEDIRNNEEIKTYIQKADQSLAALGYTEHSFAHVGMVAENCGYILETLGFEPREVELARIASYLHDIGNLVNRVDHSQSGAVMAFQLLRDMGMAPAELADITRQLLAFARRQIAAPKVLDLNETIEGMLKMLGRREALFSVALSVGVALGLFAGSALADKPEWAGGGKGKKAQSEERDRSDRSGGVSVMGFGSDDRRVVSDYYGTQARAGHCPPGLAKKHNGCQPPGQAKKWRKGYPLGRDVEYFELPRELRMRLAPPPPNHRYVQVAGDVLMIAVGTGMVVDAIEDILR